MDYVSLDKKVLGGQGGEGILIEDIVFAFDTDNKTGEETAYIELLGTAYTVLADQYNPKAGFKELEEPLPVKDRVKVEVKEGQKNDNDILFHRINRTFPLSKPLVDAIDTWERFTKDGEDSVYDQIKGHPAYFQVNKNTSKTGDSWGHYFTNLIAVAKREDAEMGKVADKLAAIRKKKAAKQKEKEAAEAELTGVGSDGGDPIPF